MKTIAVATDLTPNGNKAAYFALQLAHAQQADLLLINVFHFWPLNPAETGGDFSDQCSSHARRQSAGTKKSGQ